jgi:hypothetical protein
MRDSLGVSALQQMASRFALGLALVSLGCGRGANARTARDAPSSRHPSRQAPSLADTVLITGPTIVAAFAVTQAEADTSDDVNEALSDFQFHLNSARDSLRAEGIALVERYDSIIPIREDWGTWSWRLGADSGRVGYLFVAPRRPAKELWGVMSDVDLIESATQYFGKR